METVISENSTNENKCEFKAAGVWFSKSILRSITIEQLSQFRVVEKISVKIDKYKCHLLYNETCLNNNLLPKYTNIIYIYIYISFMELYLCKKKIDVVFF